LDRKKSLLIWIHLFIVWGFIIDVQQNDWVDLLIKSSLFVFIFSAFGLASEAIDQNENNECYCGSKQDYRYGSDDERRPIFPSHGTPITRKD